MHREGHYGVALLVYAPIGFLLLAAGLTEFALAGGAIVVGGAMLPDLDMRIPFVTHRGITHTVWFAIGVGTALAVGGVAAGIQVGLLEAAVLGFFGLFVGVLTVSTHLLADALTPMGIRPFQPIDDRKYSLDVVTAANPIANYGLLAIGVVVAGIVVFTGLELA